MNVMIRPARVEDAEAIWELNEAALGYVYPLSKTSERLRQALESPFNRVLVACDETGRTLGYIHAADYDNTYTDRLKNILALAVRPDCQGNGVGRALLRAAEDWARQTGCAGVRLVSGHNRTGAHQFYQRCGYFMRKEQKNFIKLFDRDA